MSSICVASETLFGVSFHFKIDFERSVQVVYVHTYVIVNIADAWTILATKYNFVAS